MYLQTHGEAGKDYIHDIHSDEGLRWGWGLGEGREMGVGREGENSLKL